MLVKRTEGRDLFVSDATKSCFDLVIILRPSDAYV